MTDDIYIDPSAHVSSEAKIGALSRVLASRMTEKKIRSIQITTDKSYIDCDLLRKELITHQQSNTVQEAGKPYVISSLEQQVQVLPQEALLTELQAFIALCSGESVDIPDVEAGLNSLRISDKILNSINSLELSKGSLF